MRQEIAEKFKKELERERAELLKKLNADKTPSDFGSDVDDFDEETDEAEEFLNQVARDQDLKDRLSEVDIALAKIGDGKYGKCENCGKEIEDAVLDASPESRFCRECKAKAK